MGYSWWLPVLAAACHLLGLAGSAGGACPRVGVSRAAEGSRVASSSLSAQLTGLGGGWAFRKTEPEEQQGLQAFIVPQSSQGCGHSPAVGARSFPGTAALGSAFHSVGTSHSCSWTPVLVQAHHTGDWAASGLLPGSLLPGLSGDSGCWWLLSFGFWLPGTDATSQRPGIRVAGGTVCLRLLPGPALCLPRDTLAWLFLSLSKSPASAPGNQPTLPQAKCTGSVQTGQVIWKPCSDGR